MVEKTYQSCGAALGRLGLHVSQALEDVYDTAIAPSVPTPARFRVASPEKRDAL